MTPNQYPRRILLAVTGMSPQVVTETLYALYTEQGFVPTEIRIITTQQGKVRVVHDLLGHPDSGSTGHFHRFCHDYGLTGQIAFDESHISLISDADGVPLPDIRTPEENGQAADCIARLVKEACADDHAAVHVSIAGGRKSMGFFIGYALSLFARPQDRLSHVLVSAPFESNHQFFYPPPSSRKIASAQGEELDAAEAKVMLADIPLVRLRDGLPESLLTGLKGYSATVTAAQTTMEPPLLQFDLHLAQVSFGNTSIKLSPTQFCVYALLAQFRLADESMNFIDDSCVQAFIALYAKAFGERSGRFQPAVDAVSKATDSELRAEYFRPHISKINAILTKQLGQRTALPYLINSSGKRNYLSYSLSISPEQIHF